MAGTWAAVLRFTLVMGPLSSALRPRGPSPSCCGASARRRRRSAPPGSSRAMATPVLVIFLIRTHGPAWRAAAPHPALVATSLSALAVALALSLGPLAALLGFAPLPGALLAVIAGLVVGYLALAELLKRFASRAGRHEGGAAGPGGAAADTRPWAARRPWPGPSWAWRARSPKARSARSTNASCWRCATPAIRRTCSARPGWRRWAVTSPRWAAARSARPPRCPMDEVLVDNLAAIDLGVDRRELPHSPFLRNFRDGWGGGGLQHVAERLRPALEVGQHALPVSLLVVGRPGIGVGHAVPQGVVEQHGDLARGGGDRLGLADARRTGGGRRRPAPSRCARPRPRPAAAARRLGCRSAGSWPRAPCRRRSCCSARGTATR